MLRLHSTVARYSRPSSPAYASRQTFTAGFSIRQTAEMLKKKILEYACEVTRQTADNLDIIASNIVDLPLPTGPNIPNNRASVNRVKSIVWRSR